MLNYDKYTNEITIIAKDTGDFNLSIKNYILDEGDTVYFTVNSELEKKPPALISKAVTDFIDGGAIIRLTSDDTNIPIGNYYYDIQVNTADGRVDTVLGPAKFKVKGGVRY